MDSRQAASGVNSANEKPLHLCPNCSAYAVAPKWPERLKDRCVRNVWSCDVCGFEFETAATFTTKADIK
jgi:ribosomal protein L37AE/L43A